MLVINAPFISDYCRCQPWSARTHAATKFVSLIKEIIKRDNPQAFLNFSMESISISTSFLYILPMCCIIILSVFRDIVNTYTNVRYWRTPTALPYPADAG